MRRNCLTFVQKSRLRRVLRAISRDDPGLTMEELVQTAGQRVGFRITESNVRGLAKGDPTIRYKYRHRRKRAVKAEEPALLRVERKLDVILGELGIDVK